MLLTDRQYTLIRLFLNPLYTGGLFHCCMLDMSDSICHFWGAGSILLLLLYF